MVAATEPDTSPGGLMICRARPIAAGQGLRLLSDLHLGSPVCDEDHILRELAAAKKAGDRIAINGDVFDMILAKDKKRYRPGAVHPRFHGSDDMVGLVLEHAIDMLKPYADLIDMVGIGNHDETVVKHGNYCAVSKLVKDLQKEVTDRKHHIHFGGYQGFLRYPLPGRESLTIFYWHGMGGGASLSGALAEFDKKGTFIEGADVRWFAHKHVRFAVPVSRVICSPAGPEPLERTVWYVRTAAYMKSYGGQSQASWRARGRKSNYAADGLYTPYGCGGMRAVYLGGPAKALEFRTTSE